MVRFDEGDEVWVVRVAKIWRVVVFYEHAFILETNDRYAIAVIVCQGAKA